MIWKENLVEDSKEKYMKPKIIVIAGPTASRKNSTFYRTCKKN